MSTELRATLPRTPPKIVLSVPVVPSPRMDTIKQACTTTGGTSKDTDKREATRAWDRQSPPHSTQPPLRLLREGHSRGTPPTRRARASKAGASTAKRSLVQTSYTNSYGVFANDRFPHRTSSSGGGCPTKVGKGCLRMLSSACLTVSSSWYTTITSSDSRRGNHAAIKRSRRSRRERRTALYLIHRKSLFLSVVEKKRVEVSRGRDVTVVQLRRRIISA